MAKVWQLLPGDRVVHWDDHRGGSQPVGTISRVDPEASFFPYWVQWDTRWRGYITEGAFQSSCFDFAEMERRGMRPKMTAERHARLDEFVKARMEAYRAGTVKAEGKTDG